MENAHLSRRAALAIAGLSLAINFGLLAVVAVQFPAYLSDYRLDANVDAEGYVALAVNVWNGHGYSQQSAPPYLPDMLRTPLYPLLLGGILKLFGTIWPVYALQALCSATTAVAIATAAAIFFGSRIGLVSGLLVSTDLTLVSLNFEAMTESLFMLLTASGILMWVRTTGDACAHYSRSTPYAKSGMLLGLAALTRPAGLYLPAVLAAVTIVLSKRKRVGGAVVLAATAYLVIVPWIVRNAVTFKVARLSSVEAINLTWYMGAGAYQLRYGLDLRHAQSRIADDYQLPPIESTFEYWQNGKGVETVAAIDRQLRQAAWAIVHDYPLEITLSSLIGLSKASFGDTTSSIGYLSRRNFTHPQFSRLLQGRWRAAANALRSNNLPLIGWFLWQTLHAVLVLAAAVLAIFLSIYSGRCRGPMMAILAIISYQYLTVAMVGLNAWARQRTATAPFLAIFAACAVVWVADAVRGSGSFARERV